VGRGGDLRDRACLVGNRAIPSGNFVARCKHDTGKCNYSAEFISAKRFNNGTGNYRPTEVLTGKSFSTARQKISGAPAR